MRLTKHHGSGNDFLVLLDLGGVRPITADDAVAACDRRTGIGADGILRVTAGHHGADVTMELRNADGSPAEMSGNGIRCLAQAVFQARLVPPPVLQVATAAGIRTVTVEAQSAPHTHQMRVDMGAVKVVGAEPEWVGVDVLQALRVDVGNPHVVLLWSAAALPDRERLIALGSQIDAATPGGANVEVIAADPDGHHVDMVVFERGVGPTMACGTGACAAAAAAQEWGLCGTTVTVQMPGGPVQVTLGDPVVLSGAVTSVARIETVWQ